MDCQSGSPGDEDAQDWIDLVSSSSDGEEKVDPSSEDWSDGDHPSIVAPLELGPFASGMFFRQQQRELSEMVFIPIEATPQEEDLQRLFFETEIQLKALKRRYEMDVVRLINNTSTPGYPLSRDYAGNVEDIILSDGDVTLDNVTDFIVFSSWTSVRIRGSYKWTMEKRFRAVQAMGSPLFNRRRWGAIVDCLGFHDGGRVHPSYHIGGTLGRAVITGDYFPPQGLIRPPASSLTRLTLREMDPEMIWAYPVPEATKTSIFIHWYALYGADFRIRYDPMYAYDRAYSAASRTPQEYWGRHYDW